MCIRGSARTFADRGSEMLIPLVFIGTVFGVVSGQ
jgi:hypothetical protein